MNGSLRKLHATKDFGFYEGIGWLLLNALKVGHKTLGIGVNRNPIITFQRNYDIEQQTYGKSSMGARSG